MILSRSCITSMFVLFSDGCERHHSGSPVASSSANVGTPSYQFCTQAMSHSDVLAFLKRTYVVDTGI